MSFWKCPNCGGEFADALHPENGCAVGLLQRIAYDRGGITEERAQRLAALCDVDYLWTKLGPIIDAFEEGEFYK